MNIRRLAWLGAFLLAVPGCAFADCLSAPPDLTSPGKLTIATHLTTPPQGFLQDDKPAGFAIEIGEAIASQMCLKAEFVNLAFAGMFPGLDAKKFDTIIAGIGITPQRQQAFDFVPYFQGGVRLITRKDTDYSFASEADLCGVAVATQTGSTEAIT